MLTCYSESYATTLKTIILIVYLCINYTQLILASKNLASYLVYKKNYRLCQFWGFIYCIRHKTYNKLLIVYNYGM